MTPLFSILIRPTTGTQLYSWPLFRPQHLTHTPHTPHTHHTHTHTHNARTSSSYRARAPLRFSGSPRLRFPWSQPLILLLLFNSYTSRVRISQQRSSPSQLNDDCSSFYHAHDFRPWESFYHRPRQRRVFPVHSSLEGVKQRLSTDSLAGRLSQSTENGKISQAYALNTQVPQQRHRNGDGFLHGLSHGFLLLTWLPSL